MFLSFSPLCHIRSPFHLDVTLSNSGSYTDILFELSHCYIHLYLVCWQDEPQNTEPCRLMKASHQKRKASWLTSLVKSKVT
jgi:hypothetical protein